MIAKQKIILEKRLRKIVYVCVLILLLPFSQLNAADLKNDLAPIDDPLQSVFANAEKIGKEKVKAAIISGAAARKWKVVAETKNRITLTTTVDEKYVINIAVDYDDNSYRFHYLDSTNLLYVQNGKTREIHPNYNVWIVGLATTINNFAEASAIITRGDAVKPPPASKTSRGKKRPRPEPQVMQP